MRSCANAAPAGASAITTAKNPILHFMAATSAASSYARRSHFPFSLFHLASPLSAGKFVVSRGRLGIPCTLQKSPREASERGCAGGSYQAQAHENYIPVEIGTHLRDRASHGCEFGLRRAKEERTVRIIRPRRFPILSVRPVLRQIFRRAFLR